MIRVGNGCDVHKLDRGLPLWICGIQIESSKGCVAHSDGDTPLHALCDALLGALALGDIGKHFPDTSEEYRGIDSKLLLRRVYKLIEERGYRLVNADITIVLQQPKLAPYIERMRETIAAILQSPVSSISVKATTSEHLGFTGREEGIAAYAVVLVSDES